MPLDENAVRQIRDSATSLDLYTWLSYRLPRINKTRPTVISWSQLAVHFGNEGNNIRKFRQTIRDSWERQVSAVYPEARAEFDTAAIRLYASPAPMARRPLRLVTGTNLGEPAQIDMAIDGAVSSDFLRTLRDILGATHAKHWLDDAAMENQPDGPALCAGSQFKADYIRRTFMLEINRAASVCGLTASPCIVARRRPLP